MSYYMIIYIYIYIYTHRHTYIDIHVCIHVYIYIYMYIHVSIYVYMCIYVAPTPCPAESCGARRPKGVLVDCMILYDSMLYHIIQYIIVFTAHIILQQFVGYMILCYSVQCCMLLQHMHYIVLQYVMLSWLYYIYRVLRQKRRPSPRY